MEQHLRQLITTLGLADAVRMVGRVSRRDLAGLYRRAALYVSPGVEKSGHVEGFGISFVEAMLAGVPAIAGNAGGVSDCVIDGVTGFTIEPSAQSLKGAILSVLCDTKLRQSLGAAARRYALEHFSYRAQGQRLVELLKLSA
jgi:phosphatidylinositol alpha-1,6-mannosyltransferase